MSFTNRLVLTKRVLWASAVMGLVSCGPGATQPTSEVSAPAVFADKPHNFRLSLTDAPKEDLKSVFVNVNHAELRLSGGGKEARVIVARNLGEVDLLKLQNGVTLPMADMNLPEGVSVTQIRLVLEGEGNYIVKMDGSRCDLKTPSAQKTGVKFIHQGVTIEKGYSYSIVADFDAKKSVVLQGNGGCLLKPVVKLKSASRIELPPPADNGSDDDSDDSGDSDDTGGTPSPSPTPAPTPGSDDGSNDGQGEPIADEDDSTQEGDDGGWDIVVDPENLPPEIPEDQLEVYF